MLLYADMLLFMKPPRPDADAPFPIIEAFGYSALASTNEARKAWAERTCPFAGTACEKFKQYKYGYCSVTYAAQDHMGSQRTYAVCDHRLDGDPVARAIADRFGSTPGIQLASEVVLDKPKTSFDYVAYAQERDLITDAIAIETQAIDIRGGGVGPAWNAWQDGKLSQWRDYFSIAARSKNRKDVVAYGVNMANIYKRLGLQVAEKGAYLKRIGVPFYVVMQDLPFLYLRRRIPFSAVDGDWDITFMTSEYTGKIGRNGAMEFSHCQTVRTTLPNYLAALNRGSRSVGDDRADFLERVKRKANLRK
ncbi:MAG: hypothetical protein IT473_03455 [Lysobacter sp.]|nr:hypothetical protein [Lysobacter sp.]